jgi:hypothetical protein
MQAARRGRLAAPALMQRLFLSITGMVHEHGAGLVSAVPSQLLAFLAQPVQAGLDHRQHHAGRRT